MRVAAVALRSRCITGGHRIVIVSENSATTLALLPAAQMLRAWPAVITPRLPAAEIQGMIECVQSRLLLFSTEHSDNSRERAKDLDAKPLAIDGLGPIAALRHRPTSDPYGAAEHAGEELGLLISRRARRESPRP